MGFDADTTGVKRLKSTPPGFSVHLKDFDRAIEWVKAHVKEHYGIHLSRVMHEANTNQWFFYETDEEGPSPVVSLSHTLMERLLLVLEKMEWLMLCDAASPNDPSLEELEKVEEEDDEDDPNFHPY